MNPTEYERKFFEFDANRDRHINHEEFRRFLGKEPKQQEEKPKKKKQKVHFSNLQFFWDGIEWISYTPQEVSDGIYLAAMESKRSEIAKNDPEKAEQYKWITEWQLYDDVKTRTANVYIDSDKGKQLESGPFYITFDRIFGKYVCMALNFSNNFFMVDDMSQVVPKTFEQAPSSSVENMGSLTETVLNLLAWVNERRFEMPWRWSLWSQTYSNVLNHLENNRTFLKDHYLDEDDKKDELTGDAKTTAIKKIRKRLQIFKEREVAQELYRVHQPIASTDSQNAYRARKTH